jgi:hypothetical protein
MTRVKKVKPKTVVVTPVYSSLAFRVFGPFVSREAAWSWATSYFQDDPAFAVEDYDPETHDEFLEHVGADGELI